MTKRISSIILLTLAFGLVGCSGKVDISHEDKVKVIEGFYKGKTGVVVEKLGKSNTKCGFLDYENYYLIQSGKANYKIDGAHLEVISQDLYTLEQKIKMYEEKYDTNIKVSEEK